MTDHEAAGVSYSDTLAESEVIIQITTISSALFEGNQGKRKSSLALIWTVLKSQRQSEKNLLHF